MSLPHSEGLVFRQDYFGDRAAYEGLADLLQAVFGIDIRMLDRFGGPDPSSVAFGYFDAEGCCVANFSLFAMPLMLEGREILAAGYQSGAVLPAYRGRGLYRDLMRRAFALAAARGLETGFLLTDKPDLYRRYGFRVVPEHRSAGAPGTFAPLAGGVREINLAHAADVLLLRNLLAHRMPVSRRFAVNRQAQMFFFNAALDSSVRLSLLTDLAAVVAWRRDAAGTLVLLDVVGAEIPPLAAILARLGQPADIVSVEFTTDRMGWSGEPLATPAPGESGCVLMVSGAYEATSGDAAPIMLSPLAAF